MDKRLLTITVTLALFLILVQSTSALPVYLSPKNSSGDLQLSGSFDYAFNLSIGSACSNILYTQKETVVLDKYGFGFVNLNNTNMTGIPTHLCEYRNDSGVLAHRANHSIPDHVARDFFGASMNLSGNVSAANFNSGNATLNQGWFNWLGSIINPILKGWFNDVNTANLTVTDNTTVKNLYATGNITADNVFLPQYLFSHTNQTLPVGGVGVWTNITFAQEEAMIKVGVEHTQSSVFNYTFNITQEGVYDVTYDIDLEDTSGSASDIDVASRLIFLNGTEVVGSVFETDIVKQNKEVELSHHFLVKLLVGDQIVFQFTAGDVDVQISTHGTYGDHPESASAVINKVAN